MIERPHFITIGAMKCATSTLHEQLARQPGVFMSEPKEPCFFSDDEVYARGLDWYRSLFDAAPAGVICGESSTHYTKRPIHPSTVERMKRHLRPDIKLIYVIRHPIDRLVSQYIHQWTENEITEPIDEAIDRHPELIDYSRYAMQLEPFFEAYSPRQVLPVFFERLRSEPQRVLERVCDFIGCEARPVWREEARQQNASAERLRKSPLRDAIVYLPGLRQVRQRLIPQAVRDRVKRLWRMDDRPRFSDEQLRRLRGVFDEDLAVLGGWLGTELTCENFKAVAAAGPVEWSPATIGGAA